MTHTAASPNSLAPSSTEEAQLRRCASRFDITSSGRPSDPALIPPGAQSAAASTILLQFCYTNTVQVVLETTESGEQTMCAQYSSIRWDPALSIAEELKMAVSNVADVHADRLVVEQVIARAQDGSAKAYTQLRCTAHLTLCKLNLVHAVLARLLTCLCDQDREPDMYSVELEPDIQSRVEVSADAALERVGGTAIGGRLLATIGEDAQPFAVMSGKLKPKPVAADHSEHLDVVGHFDGFRLRSRHAYFVDRSTGSMLELAFDEDRLFAQIYSACSEGAPTCQIEVERLQQNGRAKNVLVSINPLGGDLLSANGPSC